MLLSSEIEYLDNNIPRSRIDVIIDDKMMQNLKIRAENSRKGMCNRGPVLIKVKKFKKSQPTHKLSVKTIPNINIINIDELNSIVHTLYLKKFNFILNKVIELYEYRIDKIDIKFEIIKWIGGGGETENTMYAILFSLILENIIPYGNYIIINE